eukprot:sb/3471830/
MCKQATKHPDRNGALTPWRDLQDIARVYDLNIHLFADDTQIYDYPLLVGPAFKPLVDWKQANSTDPFSLGLRKVQNSAVRFINNHRRRLGVTKLRRELHFLPVDARIDFKILLLTYKCINGLAPLYLQDLITPRTQTGRNLRNDNDLTLLVRSFSFNYRQTSAAFSIIHKTFINIHK